MFRIVAFSIVLFVSAPAFAQEAIRAMREKALIELSKDYGESQIALGVT